MHVTVQEERRLRHLARAVKLARRDRRPRFCEFIEFVVHTFCFSVSGRPGLSFGFYLPVRRGGGFWAKNIY
jgi:hypothetical protein